MCFVPSVYMCGADSEDCVLYCSLESLFILKRAGRGGRGKERGRGKGREGKERRRGKGVVGEREGRGYVSGVYNELVGGFVRCVIVIYLQHENDREVKCLG